MKSMPNIFKFFGIFVICYLLMASLTHIKPVRSAIVPVYNIFQKATFNLVHPVIRTDFSKYKGTNSDFDYSVHIYSKEQYRSSRVKSQVKPFVVTNQNARITAFGPFIMLLSLIVASPISWKRKLLSFAIGGFFVLLLLSMKYTALFDANLDPTSMAILKKPGSWWIGISKFFNDAFRTNEFMSLMILPIWALSSFRLKDWKWFID